MSMTQPNVVESPRGQKRDQPNGISKDYAFRFAETPAEVEAAQRLRYAVFNLELGEGLESSEESGRDEDAFDLVCAHLLILHRPTGEVVGTYRMQSGETAERHLGYYSEQEFDFTPFEPVRHQILELGRACVHKNHRNLGALHLLWRGIAEYSVAHGSRYLLGCSSLTSQDMDLGWASYQKLAKDHLADPALRTVPLPDLAVHPSPAYTGECPPLPKLLRAYLALGGKICGPPAIDREFKTIDFLTLLDLDQLPSAVREHFFGQHTHE